MEVRGKSVTPNYELCPSSPISYLPHAVRLVRVLSFRALRESLAKAWCLHSMVDVMAARFRGSKIHRSRKNQMMFPRHTMHVLDSGMCSWRG